MKIVWIAPQPPIAPLTGGRERARRMIEYLAARHDVHLITFAAPEEQPGLDTLAGTLRGITRLDYPVWPDRARIARQRVVDRVIAEVAPDVIHAQTGAMWGLIPAPFKGRRILDCHDAPGRVDQSFRPSALAKLMGFKPPFNIGNPDAIITVSGEDADILRTYRPTCPISVLPNGVDVAYWSEVPRALPTEPELLFPAALNWGPNVNSIQEFLGVFSQVRGQIPTARLVVAGHSPDPDLRRAIAAEPSATLIADPPDMRPLFAKAAAIVVPLLYGTGTRLKILQALAAGRPVVSTPVGAMGLGLEPGRHLLVANMTPSFGDALVMLLSDPALRQSLAEAGRDVIGRYDWPNFLPILDTVYPP